MSRGEAHLFKIKESEVNELLILAKITFTDAFAKDNTPENMHQYLSAYLTKEQLLKELKNPGSEFYFLKINNTPIGYLKLNQGDAQTEIKDHNALEIERIYVLQDYQGQNFGRVLFEKALQVANENNYDYIWLGVWEHNHKAIKFYEKNGFVKFSEHAFKLGDDVQTDILMKRVLTLLIL